MNIIVADDELKIRMGVKALLSRQDNINNIYTASNGEEALQFVREYRPEIVITDVKMPIMDGLELAAKTRTLLPRTRLMLITGHEEFEFARQAIQLNAEDYILKPIEPQTLLSSVQRVIKSVKEEREEAGHRRKLENHLMKTYPYLKSWFFNTIQQSGDDFEKCMSELINYNMIRNADRFQVINVNLTPEKIEGRDAIDDQHNLFDGICKMLQLQLCSCIPFFDMNCFTIIFCLQEETAKQVFDIAENIEDYLKFNFKGSFTIGIGSQANNLKEMLTSYKDAMVACKYEFYIGKNHTIFIEDMKLSQNSNYYEIPNELITLIQVGNTKSALEMVEHVYVQMREQKTKIECVRQITMEICWHIKRAMLKDVDTLDIGDIPWKKINDGTSLKLLYEIITNLLNKQGEMLDRIRKSKNKITIENAIKIINEQCGSANISLEYVAEAVYLSPSYLSNLFSKEIGTTFKNYLINKRIELAKKLLKQNSYKIYEVSELCGYTNSHHFSQLFKRIVGITPKQYIEQNA